MNTRTDWVDYAKAIGIILVVYGHVARGLYNAGIEMPDKLYHLADSVIYSFHMPLFFFLSGLFFYRSFSKRGGPGLALNKLDTIVYPYLIWSILQGGIEVFLSNHTNGSIKLSEVMALWEPRAQFWFLYALFLIFAVSCAIYSFFPEKYSYLIFVATALLYTNGALPPHTKALAFIYNNLPFFVFGILFTKHNLMEKLSPNVFLPITAIAFIAFQYVFHAYLGKSYTDKGPESLLLACTSILFVASLSVAITRKPNRLLALIGASSMAIYLMHILAGSGARVILSKLFGVESTITHLTAGCLAGLLLPLLALKLIDSLKISYVFSAPISKWIMLLYSKALQRAARGTSQGVISHTKSGE